MKKEKKSIYIDGILLINKPADMTSYDVIRFLKKKTGVKKIGHSGILDKAATGLLIILLGKATKLQEFFMELNKTYKVELILGIKTDTGDLTGKIEKTILKKIEITGEEIEKIIEKFKGEITQIPPKYSALKKDGKRFSDIARSGGDVPKRPRKVYIYNITNITKQNGNIICFEVECSRGAYMRTLCEDIGEKTGYLGSMKSLERTKIGNYSIKDALEINDNKDADYYLKNVLGMDSLTEYISVLHIDRNNLLKLIAGNSIIVSKQQLKINNRFKEKSLLAVIYNDELYGIAKIIKKEKKYCFIKPFKNLRVKI